MITLEEFLKQKHIEYQKYLWKLRIINSPEYKATMLKDLFLEEQMKGFQENPNKLYSFQDEYMKMISLLKFVFPDIPQDRYAYRSYRLLTDDETEKYDKIQESKNKEILFEINENSGKLFCLLSYLLLMKTSKFSSRIHNIEEKIRNVFHSFSEELPQYQYSYIKDVEKKSDNRNTRKTNPNKSEMLDDLYKCVFIKRSNNLSDDEKTSGFTPYINEDEKSIVEFLLHIDPDKQNILFLAEQRIIDQLIQNDRSELDETQKAEKAYEKCTKIIYATLGETLLKEAKKLHDYYEDARNMYLYPVYAKNMQLYPVENPMFKEQAFAEINSEEIDFINYLYQLYYNNCEKYEEGTDKWETYNIANPKNSRKWDILKKAEKETLSEYIEKLCDDDRTVLKYIGKKDLEKYNEKYFLFDENSDEDQNIEEDDSSLNAWKIRQATDQAKEIMYSLAATVRNDPYYHTFKQSERIFQFLKSAPNSLDLENPDIKKLYADLEAKMKNADAIYLKLVKYLRENPRTPWLKDGE